MSSTRRTANEIHILAMLDRHEGGGLPQRLLRGLRGKPPALWYGAAAVLVCAMVGTLAWLARDTGGSASVDSALVGAVVAKGTGAIAAAPPAPASASLALPEAPDSASDTAPAAGASIVDLAPEPAVPPHPLPQQQRAGRVTPHEAAHEPQHLAAHAATAKPALQTGAAKPPAAVARNRRAAASPKAAPDTVDTDVALISAIIQHANARQEAEEAARKP